jgi:hypothetical protein
LEKFLVEVNNRKSLQSEPEPKRVQGDMRKGTWEDGEMLPKTPASSECSLRYTSPWEFFCERPLFFISCDDARGRG